jgi:hypothetical protein
MNITVSLETAKKLKEAGWEKETIFEYGVTGKLHYAFESDVIGFHAPTLQEILEELPNDIMIIKRGSQWQIKDTKEHKRFSNIYGECLLNAVSILWIMLKGGTE